MVAAAVPSRHSDKATNFPILYLHAFTVPRPTTLYPTLRPVQIHAKVPASNRIALPDRFLINI